MEELNRCVTANSGNVASPSMNWETTASLTSKGCTCVAGLLSNAALPQAPKRLSRFRMAVTRAHVARMPRDARTPIENMYSSQPLIGGQSTALWH